MLSQDLFCAKQWSEFPREVTSIVFTIYFQSSADSAAPTLSCKTEILWILIFIFFNLLSFHPFLFEWKISVMKICLYVNDIPVTQSFYSSQTLPLRMRAQSASIPLNANFITECWLSGLKSILKNEIQRWPCLIACSLQFWDVKIGSSM